MPERSWTAECRHCGKAITITEPLSWLYDLASGGTTPYHPDCAREVEIARLTTRLTTTIRQLDDLGVVATLTITRP